MVGWMLGHPFSNADLDFVPDLGKEADQPDKTGISPTNVQTKSEPDAALAATIHTPKAISPTETKYERAVSMASRLRFFCDLVDG